MSEIFTKVLIANRGEIACRVIRTCKHLGIRTVAVYSEADMNALHVRMADEAVYLGPPPAEESYLSISKILDAARKTGAEAIHPGYGFLSEDEAFAEACSAAGLVFIGPPASAIRAMGSKSAAKALMERAGVPLTPGYHGDEQSGEFLRAQADAIGYPVLIKASAGGGGKGMRRVDAGTEFAAALASCRREAAASFGDDRVLIERYILKPRHIEIQVFADSYGNVVSLFERDCSVQRRHQKVVEEAPAPGMSSERRLEMGRAACDAARAVGYVGAGTVEFIADSEGNFHFMEMNTRLQVEHPVTEMITGLDLVEWQLRVAAGQHLPRTQDQLHIDGHAIEVRVYAEDPANEFLPSTGKLLYLREPDSSKHVRVDAGVQQGDVITAFYDPMLAKLIVWEPTRSEALRTMRKALSDLKIVGVKTNVAFLERLVLTPSFVEARLDTGLIDREKEGLFAPLQQTPPLALYMAALCLLLKERGDAKCSALPWDARDGWRLSGRLRRTLRFSSQGGEHVVAVEYADNGYVFERDGQFVRAQGTWQEDNTLVASFDGKVERAHVVLDKEIYTIFALMQRWELRFLDPLIQQGRDDVEESSLFSPMPGLLRSILVQPETRVEKGTPLVVLEAMKMEYTIEAPARGKVREFFFEVGSQVPEGTQLLHFDAEIEGTR